MKKADLIYNISIGIALIGELFFHITDITYYINGIDKYSEPFMYSGILFITVLISRRIIKKRETEHNNRKSLLTFLACVILLKDFFFPLLYVENGKVCNPSCDGKTIIIEYDNPIHLSTIKIKRPVAFLFSKDIIDGVTITDGRADAEIKWVEDRKIYVKLYCERKEVCACYCVDEKYKAEEITLEQYDSMQAIEIQNVNSHCSDE